MGEGFCESVIRCHAEVVVGVIEYIDALLLRNGFLDLPRLSPKSVELAVLYLYA